MNTNAISRNTWLCGVLSLFWSTLGYGEESLTAEPPEARSSKSSLAVGTTLAWVSRRDYGSGPRQVFSPGIVGFYYRNLPWNRLHLRVGARLAGHGFTQAQMPDSLRITEGGAAGNGELGVLFDGPMIPSVTLGMGLEGRRVQFRLKEPIVSDPMTKWQALPSAYVQIGVGLPLARGALVLEPFVRVEVTAGDERSYLRYGLDVTLSLP